MLCAMTRHQLNILHPVKSLENNNNKKKHISFYLSKIHINFTISVPPKQINRMKKTSEYEKHAEI